MFYNYRIIMTAFIISLSLISNLVSTLVFAEGTPISTNAGHQKKARAYWLSKDTIAWNVSEDSEVGLHYSTNGELSLNSKSLLGGSRITLIRDGVVSGKIAQKFKHLQGLPAYKIPAVYINLVPEILRGQFAVSAINETGSLIDATSLQPPGVLDDLFHYNGDLGVSFDKHHNPTVRVWAPTARSVKLHLFDNSSEDPTASAIIPMARDNTFGVWTADGNYSWDRKYYLYEVEVFVRATGKFETNLVTAPYSLNLSVNSKRSQIINLQDHDLMPRGWYLMRKPKLRAPEDAAIYELHVRDFSMNDPRISQVKKGTFAAFASPLSHGMHHLAKLARAGLTHVHLLPSFDCATIPENRANQKDPGDLSSYSPNSEKQQEIIHSIRDQDGFNWCYDPLHYTVPEGSYSTNPDGPTRILEFRQMIAGLNRTGLRVIMDVVYNHTNSSGQTEKSVLDRIVPDYYHRLNSAGDVEMSSCCPNTASEHSMMEKLMLDSLRTWATQYKVDGFRFDLMGHHTKDNIIKARDMLRSLRLSKDGVDGRAIYIYGEGWNFGEVANDSRFIQATQANMGDKTGVGSFNDRMRDGVRGEGPFDSGITHVQRQGFVNGLYTDPNSENSGSQRELEELLRLKDFIRVGLAGSIANFKFTDRTGKTVSSSEVDYNGQKAGYTSDPQEVINYVAAHDNETLFDNNQYKLPRTTGGEGRVRAANLANSITILSQGIPFLHAGQDILRSKSMDRNSYNSGDWFNILDFTLTKNGWGRGLPPAEDNSGNWAVQGEFLGDPALGVNSSEIRKANLHVREMLRIRRSLRLFRLRTSQAIVDRVAFHNTGPTQVPGVIVMSLKGYSGIEVVVVFNADKVSQRVSVPILVGRNFRLHPYQKRSYDRVVSMSSYDITSGTFYTPARTTAVFVSRHVHIARASHP